MTAGTADPNNVDFLKSRVADLEGEVMRLSLKVKDLNHRLWGTKSERVILNDDGTVQQVMDGILGLLPVEIPDSLAHTIDGAEHYGTDQSEETNKTTNTTTKKKRKKSNGWRVDLSKLEQDVVMVPHPDPKDLINPSTGKPMEELPEVAFYQDKVLLARRPSKFYAKVLRRPIYKTETTVGNTIVSAPWPQCALPGSQMDASVLAYIVVSHCEDHIPYYRLQKIFARMGVHLPRATQVALMKELNKFVSPLIDEIRSHVFGGGYLNLDATPVKMMDPEKPGKAYDAAFWVYRRNTKADENLVWFDFAMTKQISSPDKVLTEANGGAGYSGILQTDGANGLGNIGITSQITHIGCWAHARRPFFEAYQKSNGKDLRAKAYLKLINELFHIERRARHFSLSPPQIVSLRKRYSISIFQTLMQYVEEDISANMTPDSTHLGRAICYLKNQRASLERCLTTPVQEYMDVYGAKHTFINRIDNNLVENSIRPVKIGMKNFLFIGHPKAGPRLGNLYTLIENCRLAQVDAETYLIDIIARLQDHNSSRLYELLPHAWKLEQQTRQRTP